MSEQGAFVETSRKQWSSEPAFIASMAAAAVGLGNLWRFPYVMGENGGGAFVVAYLLSLFVLVLPIMMLEVAAGRLSQGSTVGTYRKVHRFGAWYGWFVVAVTVAITSYYLVITGWTMGYAFDAMVGNVRTFDVFSQGYNSFWWFLALTTASGLVLIRGVGAIELLSKVLMPVLLLVILFLVYQASQTSGWEEASAFFFTIDSQRLLSRDLWVAAFGQAFYTLAIGQGYLVTYGSFIPGKTNVPRATLLVAAFQTSIALLAGWMIFPFVFSFGMAPSQGTALAFETLPRVFEQLPGGGWLAILFFGLFFAAAFTSSIAGLKVIIAAIGEQFSLSNRRSVIYVCLAMAVLGTASALSHTPLQWQINGEPVLSFIDRVIGGEVIIFSGLFGAALLCWRLPQHDLLPALGSDNPWWVWRIYTIGRYLPIAVLVWAIVSFVIQEIG